MHLKIMVCNMIRLGFISNIEKCVMSENHLGNSRKFRTDFIFKYLVLPIKRTRLNILRGAPCP